MTNEKEDTLINLDDMNYAIYKLGNWKTEYKINLIGLSNEIPLTENTKDHVIFSMNQIRNSEFDFNGTPVNGFIALAYGTNPNIQKMPVNELIDLEKQEFDNIMDELNDLEFLKNPIKLDDDEYLIYKLEEECHIRKAIPANEFTLAYHNAEIEKLKKQID